MPIKKPDNLKDEYQTHFMRLASNIEIDPLTNCWNYTTKDEMISVGGKIYRTHRLSWFLYNGCPTNADHNFNTQAFCVKQTCGNEKCCHPSHLQLQPHTGGTNHKLSNSQILELYHKTQVPVKRGGLKALAEEYKVSYQTVMVIKKKTYPRLLNLLKEA